MWQRLLYGFLAAIVLMSSMGMSFSSHWCNGELMELAVMKSVEICCKPIEDACEFPQERVGERGCCDFDVTWLEGIDLSTISSTASFSYDFSLDFPFIDQVIVVAQTECTSIVHEQLPPPDTVPLWLRLERFLC